MLNLTSAAFENGGVIPAKYTCDGDRLLSPPLSISGVPDGAKSLALIMDDPDVPKVLRPSGMFSHWIVFNISPDTTLIGEGATTGVAGNNERGEPRYTGPCPPPEYEPREHRYIFTLYALSSQLDLPEGANKEQVLEAIGPVLIEKTELVGRYSRG